jgi:hypothetical protein
MKKITLVTFLVSSALFAASAPRDESPDFARVKQVLRLATADLKGNDYRVVFAAESNLQALTQRHWVVNVQRYPAGYKPLDDQKTAIGFGGPPCTGRAAAEFCSIPALSGEILFQGRFDMDDVHSHFRRFDGNILATASKMAAFEQQLNIHQEWTEAEIAGALNSAGAKFGPDKDKEFRAMLPTALSTLEKAFGPMRLHKVLFLKPRFWKPPSTEHSVAIGFPAYWKVIVVPLQRPKDRIVMFFDPLEGQLQQLVVTGLFQTMDPKTRKMKWEYLDPDEKELFKRIY